VSKVLLDRNHGQKGTCFRRPVNRLNWETPFKIDLVKPSLKQIKSKLQITNNIQITIYKF